MIRLSTRFQNSRLKKLEPSLNKKLVVIHDSVSGHELEMIKPDHPVIAGFPAKFSIQEELYRHSKDPQGSSIDILAQVTSPLSGKTYSNVWITKHPKGRIVCITLEHDGASHTLSAFKNPVEKRCPIGF